MVISEMKMQMTIANYFNSECDTNTSIKQAFEKGFRIGVKKGISMNRPQRWIPCSERLPKTDGLYLTAYRDFSNVVYKTHFFAHDLYMVDDLYFADKKGKSGWYSYDDEYGYFEFDAEAWMPIEPWKGADDE